MGFSIYGIAEATALALSVQAADAASDLPLFDAEPALAAPSEDWEEMIAREELLRISPSNEQLLSVIDRFRPPREWFEREEPFPFQA